jgi:hypothetical protein
VECRAVVLHAHQGGGLGTGAVRRGGDEAPACAQLDGDPDPPPFGHGLAGVAHQVNQNAGEVFGGETHAARTRQALDLQTDAGAGQRGQQRTAAGDLAGQVIDGSGKDRTGLGTGGGGAETLDQPPAGVGHQPELLGVVAMGGGEHLRLPQQVAVKIERGKHVTRVVRQSGERQAGVFGCRDATRLEP